MTEYVDQFCKECGKETTHENGECLICVGGIKETEEEVNYEEKYL